jgi:hypothetical protein
MLLLTQTVARYAALVIAKLAASKEGVSMASSPARQIVDLSHEIVDGMTTHPGIPPPSISTFLAHEASTARYQLSLSVRQCHQT